MFMWANSLIKNIVKRSILKVYLFISKLKKRELNLKDREKLENVHDVVYQAKCPDCSETYIGETARRLEERVEEHAKKR